MQRQQKNALPQGFQVADLNFRSLGAEEICSRYESATNKFGGVQAPSVAEHEQF